MANTIPMIPTMISVFAPKFFAMAFATQTLLFKVHYQMVNRKKDSGIFKVVKMYLSARIHVRLLAENQVSITTKF